METEESRQNSREINFRDKRHAYVHQLQLETSITCCIFKLLKRHTQAGARIPPGIPFERAFPGCLPACDGRATSKGSREIF